MTFERLGLYFPSDGDFHGDRNYILLLLSSPLLSSTFITLKVLNKHLFFKKECLTFQNLCNWRRDIINAS